MQDERRLAAESLEQRTLLAVITSVDPPANSFNAAASADITATFDEVINGGTATPTSFVVHRELTPSGASVSTDAMTVTADPAVDFAAGERVQVTATDAIQGAATANTPRVWQFRAGVSAGSGQFVDSGQVIGPNDPNRSDRVSFADVDGDGDVDAFAGTRLWFNDGTGVFSESGQSLTIGGEEIFFGDVDGDSDLDMIGQSDVLINNGSGVFSQGANLNGDRTAYNTAGTAGDLDGDGDLDIMQGNTYGGNRVFFNDGNGNFADSGQNLVTSGGTDSVKLGDFDGDGDLDAFEAVNGAANRTWINDGNGVFAPGQTVGTFAGTKDIDIGDVDGDGDLDLLAVNNNEVTDQNTRIWLNDGNGTFSNSGQGISPGSGSIANWAGEFGDVDADGDLDIVVADRISRTVVYLNDGSGDFSNSGQSLTFGNPGVNRRIFGMALADVDGDGDLDIWEANLSSGGNRLWLNQNLRPSTTLTVDDTTITENPGTATITATLSAVHTEDVTVELEFSGTATADDDYTASASEIVIPTGETTGTVTVTAVQDLVDDDDETVIVDIASVTNADEAGTQQVTITIIDDDDPIVVPDVTLTVDNGTIPEAEGVATFTANFSEATTVPVTVEFAVSGTAGAGDFAVSGTQIVVAPGGTTGSITVTATQDEADEADETVVVDIANVIGGSEVGAQQQTTTILDDDEPVVPDVTLAIDNTEIGEDGGVAEISVALSEATTVAVTVELGIGGTAAAEDFTASATEVVIAPGATAGSVTVTAVQDEVNEPDETVIVEVTNVTNGNELGDQQVTTTILDDDIPPSFAVTSLQALASGFHLELTNELDTSEINLYDTSSAGMGPADVVVVGASTGAVSGSLVFEANGNGITFIASGGPLAADTYNVTLRSAENGFKDTDGALLDGNGDGTGGDDYQGSFTIDELPSDARVIQLPDFVRGPGQDVNLPANTTFGIPISISDGDNVRAVDLRIGYDPALLQITDASAPAGGTVVLNTLTPGIAILVFFSTSSLPAGETEFIQLEATVPADNASENYGTSQVLDVHDVIVGDGNDNEFPAVVDDAVQLVSFFADVSGNGRINAADAAGVARFAALLDQGFRGSLTTDPTLVGDISGNGRINAADASLVARFAALIPVEEIPPLPGGVVITGEEVRLEARGAREEVAELPFVVVDNFASVDGGLRASDVDSVFHEEDEETGALASTLEDAIDSLLTSEE